MLQGHLRRPPVNGEPPRPVSCDKLRIALGGQQGADAALPAGKPPGMSDATFSRYLRRIVKRETALNKRTPVIPAYMGPEMVAPSARSIRALVEATAALAAFTRPNINPIDVLRTAMLAPEKIPAEWVKSCMSILRHQRGRAL